MFFFHYLIFVLSILNGFHFFPIVLFHQYFCYGSFRISGCYSGSNQEKKEFQALNFNLFSCKIENLFAIKHCNLFYKCLKCIFQLLGICSINFDQLQFFFHSTISSILLFLILQNICLLYRCESPKDKKQLPQFISLIHSYFSYLVFVPSLQFFFQILLTLQFCQYFCY